MDFAGENCRTELLDHMKRMLPPSEVFTIADAIAAFERSFRNDRIEKISDGILLICFPLGTIQRRVIDFVVCRQLGLEDEKITETPGQIIAQVKLPCGLPSLLMRKIVLMLSAKDREYAEGSFNSFRNTLLYRLYRNRKPIESKISYWGGDDFWQMAATIIPKMKEEGLITCGGRSRISE